MEKPDTQVPVMASTGDQDCATSEALSNHILLEVAKHLSQHSLQTCRLVCKQWRDMFSLTVDSVVITRDKQTHKLQHTLRHLQCTFPRICTVQFSSLDVAAESLCGLMTALSSQRSLQQVVLRSTTRDNALGTTCSVLCAVPHYITTLQISYQSTHCWSDEEFQLLSAFTALTSLSLPVAVTQGTCEKAAQSLLSALQGMPSLQKLELGVKNCGSNNQDGNSWLLAFTAKTAADCLSLLSTLQEFQLLSALTVTPVVLDTLIDAIRESASPNLQKAKCSFGSGFAICITADELSADGMQLPVSLQQPHTVVMPASQTLSCSNVVTLGTGHITLDCSLEWQVTTAQLCADLAGLPTLCKLSVAAHISRSNGALLSHNVPDGSRRFTITLSNASQLAELHVTRHTFLSVRINCICTGLAMQCPALRSLSLSGCNIEDPHQLTALTRLTSLQYAWHRCEAASPGFSTCWLPPSLESLHLTGCHILACPPDQCPELTKLETVYMRDCCLSGTEPLQALQSACGAMQSLILTDCYTSTGLDCIIAAASTFKRLLELRVASLRLPRPVSHVSLQSVRALAQLKQLRVLELPCATFNISAMQYIANMTQLTDITLYVEPGRTCNARACLEPLVRLPWLQMVIITCSTLYPDEVTELRTMFEEAGEHLHVSRHVDIRAIRWFPPVLSYT